MNSFSLIQSYACSLVSVELLLSEMLHQECPRRSQQMSSSKLLSVALLVQNVQNTMAPNQHMAKIVMQFVQRHAHAPALMERNSWRGICSLKRDGPSFGRMPFSRSVDYIFISSNWVDLALLWFLLFYHWINSVITMASVLDWLRHLKEKSSRIECICALSDTSLADWEFWSSPLIWGLQQLVTVYNGLTFI